MRYLFAGVSEASALFLLGAGAGRVWYGPGDVANSGGEDGADFFGAERDDDVDGRRIDGVHVRCDMGGDVDADLTKRGDRVRVERRRPRAGALYLHTFAKPRPGEPLSDLAASRIGDTQKQQTDGGLAGAGL